MLNGKFLSLFFVWEETEAGYSQCSKANSCCVQSFTSTCTILLFCVYQVIVVHMWLGINVTGY